MNKETLKKVPVHTIDGMAMVTYLTRDLGRLIGYINDLSVLIYNGEYKRELLDNVLYKYFGPLTDSDIRAVASAYTGLESVIREKGRLLGQITRAKRLWTAFMVPLDNRVAHGIMSLNIGHREVEFYIDLGWPNPMGQLPAVAQRW